MVVEVVVVVVVVVEVVGVSEVTASGMVTVGRKGEESGGVGSSDGPSLPVKEG